VYHVLIARLERRVWRLLYIALCGFALIVWLFGISALHSLITVLCVHSILTYCRGRVAVLLTFSFTMAYLTWVYLMTNVGIGHEYSINPSLPQCVLTLRLIGVAFDLLDGARAAVRCLRH
jgi:lysophospholipid acyltransferase 5